MLSFLTTYHVPGSGPSLLSVLIYWPQNSANWFDHTSLCHLAGFSILSLVNNCPTSHEYNLHLKSNVKFICNWSTVYYGSISFSSVKMEMIKNDHTSLKPWLGFSKSTFVEYLHTASAHPQESRVPTYRHSRNVGSPGQAVSFYRLHHNYGISFLLHSGFFTLPKTYRIRELLVLISTVIPWLQWNHTI